MNVKVTDVISLGEIMVESIFETDADVPVNRTLVVKDEKAVAIGGAAVNVAWYLDGLGKTVRLVAPISIRHASTLGREFKKSKVDLTGVIKIKGDTDHLFTILFPQGHRSIYTLGATPKGLKRKILKAQAHERAIVLNGGRHQEIRETFTNLVSKRSDVFIAFNPSYAIYEYDPKELLHILKNCDVCFLNEDEYRFAKQSSRESFEHLPRTAFVITRSNKGALMICGQRQFRYKPEAKHDGVILGAGDACLAGFLSGLLDRVSPEVAMIRGLRVAALVVRHQNIRTKLTAADRSWVLAV
jgi:sugar/nucleoside kinase (ribokinase family)